MQQIRGVHTRFLVAGWLNADSGSQEEWYDCGLTEAFRAYFQPRGPTSANSPAIAPEIQAWQSAAERYFAFIHTWFCHGFPDFWVEMVISTWIDLSEHLLLRLHANCSSLIGVPFFFLSPDKRLICACRLARLMMFSGRSSQAVDGLFEELSDKLSMLYTRPYLAQGTAERVLLLLQALLEVITSL